MTLHHSATAWGVGGRLVVGVIWGDLSWAAASGVQAGGGGLLLQRQGLGVDSSQPLVSQATKWSANLFCHWDLAELFLR